MSYYRQKCDGCSAAIYTTFRLKNGGESVQTRVARGAVKVAFSLKTATHSGDHKQIFKTFCVHCAPNGLVEFWQEMRGQLLNPDGVDPDRVLRNGLKVTTSNPTGALAL